MSTAAPGQPPAPHSAHAATARADRSVDLGRTSRGRHAVMLLVVLASLVAAFLGSGAFLRDATGGWFTDDGSWLSPSRPALWLWALVGLGLLASALWQFLPAAQTVRHDRLRPWIMASAVLGAAWIWTIHAAWLLVSVVVALLLVAVLFRILTLLESGHPRTVAERVLVDGVQGLHLGWATFLLVASLAAWLTSAGWAAELMPTTWAQTLIVVAAIVGLFTAVYDGGRLAPALALAWGLLWVGVGRSDGAGLFSGAVAVTAWGAAVIVLLGWVASLLLSHVSATGEARDLVLDAIDGGDDPIDGRR
ncbi:MULTISPECIES: tryptophan-rich sensory protein [unclassified Micrococcus]|uniref:tryptophan-rich sensory protein n=1 Tax=unclassified Micrococcus TaxID=2620948 RepID=UPI0020058242|nr:MULTISPECIES: tryptophan-rich sensory protein [unclassified Micrococcus]